jgi:hypothetical protein
MNTCEFASIANHSWQKPEDDNQQDIALFSYPTAQPQWRAFLKRSALTHAPEQHSVVVEARAFFEPTFASLA